MAHSTEYVKKMVAERTERTPKDKGYRMTITVEDMDNGQIAVNGVLKSMGEGPDWDREAGWTGVNVTLAQLVDEFRKHTARRRSAKGGAATGAPTSG